MRRIPSVAWVALLWALLTVPSIFIRGAHYEEGFTVGVARSAFQEGHWLAPHINGFRLAERPSLISWLLGGIGLLTGRLDLWVARIPAVLAILGTALLLHRFVRRRASNAAALCAAICFLVSPTTLQKIVTAEPDIVVGLLLFAAAIIWWSGNERGNITILRCSLLACLLSVAGLVKGPQPLAYFFLGTSGYLIWKRQFRELSKVVLIGLFSLFVVAGWYFTVYQPGDLHAWFVHSHLIFTVTPSRYLYEVGKFGVVVALDWLPGILLAVPVAVAIRHRRQQPGPDLLGFLLIYAAACTAVLIPWPGAAARYATPGFIAVCALAGLEFETVRRKRPHLTRLSGVVAIALAIYGVAVNCVVMPLFPDKFRAKALAAQRINAIVAEKPGRLYAAYPAMPRNLLLYLPASTRVLSFEELEQLEPPFWALVYPAQESALRAGRDDAAIASFPEVHEGGAHLIEVGEKQKVSGITRLP